MKQVGLISSVKGKIPQSVVAGWLFPLLLPPEGTSALAGPASLPPAFEIGFVFARSVPGLLDAELGGWEHESGGESGSCVGVVGGCGAGCRGELREGRVLSYLP